MGEPARVVFKVGNELSSRTRDEQLLLTVVDAPSHGSAALQIQAQPPDPTTETWPLKAVCWAAGPVNPNPETLSINPNPDMASEGVSWAAGHVDPNPETLSINPNPDMASEGVCWAAGPVNPNPKTLSINWKNPNVASEGVCWAAGPAACGLQPQNVNPNPETLFRKLNPYMAS